MRINFVRLSNQTLKEQKSYLISNFSIHSKNVNNCETQKSETMKKATQFLPYKDIPDPDLTHEG